MRSYSGSAPAKSFFARGSRGRRLECASKVTARAEFRYMGAAHRGRVRGGAREIGSDSSPSGGAAILIRYVRSSA